VLLIEATHPADHEVLKKHEAQIERALAKLLVLPDVFFRPNLHAELACVEDTVREVEAAGPSPRCRCAWSRAGSRPRRG
jgi:hypothetical protein